MNVLYYVSGLLTGVAFTGMAYSHLEYGFLLLPAGICLAIAIGLDYAADVTFKWR